MKSISLLHPFSAQAIGLQQGDLYYSHSKAQELALQKIQSEHQELSISIDYFTGKFFPYQKSIHNLTKRLWPVTRPLFKKRHQWRKQQSIWYNKHQQKRPEDVTIINMSGHGSSFVFKLAQQITAQGLAYIPMIGGVNMSYQGKALSYYRNAHHLLVHTQVQKEALLQQDGFTDLDIRVLPLGVNTEKFKPHSTAKKNSTPRVYKLLQVGRISRLKQIELSIELVKFLTVRGIHCELDIIGFVGDANYYNELVDLVSRHQLKAKIKFLGSLPQEDLVSHYQEADVLLIPSQHESFGMVMVEAMACGTPAIGFKGAGGTDEIIEHNINGLLVKKENWQKEVLNLLSNVNKLVNLQENTVISAQDKWSINTTSRILQNSILDAIK